MQSSLHHCFLSCPVLCQGLRHATGICNAMLMVCYHSGGKLAVACQASRVCCNMLLCGCLARHVEDSQSIAQEGLLYCCDICACVSHFCRASDSLSRPQHCSSLLGSLCPQPY